MACPILDTGCREITRIKMRIKVRNQVVPLTKMKVYLLRSHLEVATSTYACALYVIS